MSEDSLERTFTVLVHEDGDDPGMLWAEVPDLPGCFASGSDLDELKDALVEAIGLCLGLDPGDSADDHGEPAGRVDELKLAIA